MKPALSLIPIWFVLVLVILKLIEMWHCAIIPNLRRGRELADGFHSMLRREGAAAAIGWFRSSDYRPWAFSSAVLSRLSEPGRLVARWLFSWPMLTVLISAEMIFIDDLFWRIIFVVMLILLMLTRVVHRITARLFLGVADNVFLDPYGRGGGPARLNLSRVAGAALTRLVFDISAITFAFAACYFVMEEKQPSFFAPAGVSADWWHCIYFSFVTVTTSGHGEMFPEVSWAKALVLVQMVLTWSIVVVMGLHYGVSLVELEDEAFRKPDHVLQDSGKALGDVGSSAVLDASEVPGDSRRLDSGEPEDQIAVAWLEPITGAIQVVLAMLLVGLVSHYLWTAWDGTANGLLLLASEEIKAQIERLLSLFLLIIVVLELAETLASQKPEHLLNVMVFVIARKALVKVEEGWEMLAAVAAIALLFWVRHKVAIPGRFDQLFPGAASASVKHLRGLRSFMLSARPPRGNPPAPL